MSRLRVGAVALLSLLLSLAMLLPSARAEAAPPTPRLGAPARALGPAEAVELALANNPALAAAVAQAQSASWAVVGEDAVFTPTLQFDLGFDHTEQPAITPTGSTTRAGVNQLRLGSSLIQPLRIGTDLALRVEHNRRWEQDHRSDVSLLAVGPVYDTSARLQLTQPLWRGAGRKVTEAALRVAREQATEAERAAERTASQLVRDVITAWWELWYAEEALRIEREALELAVAQRDEAARRVELGSAAPVSVLTFDTRVAEREEGVATALRQRQERVVALAAQLGDASLQVEAAAPPREPVAMPHREEAKERAWALAPEVQEAEAALRVAGIRSEVAGDAFRPRLDLQGYTELGGLSDAFAGGRAGDNLAFAAGVNLIFELPLSGRPYQAAWEQGRLAMVAADRRLEQARLTAQASVEAELARLESAQARLRLAAQTAEVAEAQLAAERRRYEIGTSTPIEVLQAEEAVRSALLRQARAEVDLRSAEAAVEHLIGGLVARWVPPAL